MQNNDQTPASQTILDWLRTPNEKDRASLIEFARGTICSLSMHKDGCFAPVHISRIQRSFKRIGAAGLYKGGLRLVQLLHEAEPLHGGYWLPTPYRVVEIGEEFAFIGAVPNEHGLLGRARVEGLSRFLAPDVANLFPRQSLENWMALAPQESSAVIADFVAKHMRNEIRTSNLTDVTFLHPVAWKNTGQSQFLWSNRALGVLAAGHIAVCRQAHHGRIRYFSARLVNGRITTEAPLDISIFRLQFAVARHAGMPVRITTKSSSRGVEVTIGERLPIEEFRLALLVSRGIVRNGRSTTFIFSPKLAPLFCARLETLGCAMEIQQ